MSNRFVLSVVLTLLMIPPLLADDATNLDIDEEILALQNEKQDLFSEVDSLENQQTQIKKRIKAINERLEFLEESLESTGLSIYEGGGIPFTGKELYIYKRPMPPMTVGKIGNGKVFLIHGEDRRADWWRVEYMGIEGFVSINPHSSWVHEEDRKILVALKELRRTKNTEQEKSVRRTIQHLIETRSQTQEDLIAIAREEAIEAEKEAERITAERDRRRIELFNERKAYGRGKWEKTSSISPVDDSPTVVLMLKAERPVVTDWGSRVPTLIVRCKEGEISVYVKWGFFISSDSVSILSRLDKTSATTSSWYISTDHEGIFAPDPLLLIETLWPHDSFFLRVTPYGESPVETTFDLRGLASQIDPLREACPSYLSNSNPYF